MRNIASTGLAVTVIAAAINMIAPPAQAEQKSTTQMNLYYDVYQPSERRRMRRDTCMADEDMRGAYCVKKCDKGFVAVGSGKPPRCRSVDPLPPGRMPTAIRIQTGTQPLPPGTPAPKPAPPPPRAGEAPTDRPRPQ
jgi:hypothetical protein